MVLLALYNIVMQRVSGNDVAYPYSRRAVEEMKMKNENCKRVLLGCQRRRAAFGRQWGFLQKNGFSRLLRKG